MWSHLNYYDIDENDETFSDARRRILARLGDFAALIIGPLNLRPKAAVLQLNTPERIEVRVSTPLNHIILAIEPDGDLASEVFFLRAIAPKHLPVPHLIGHDLSMTFVPFSYLLHNYISGTPLSKLEDGPAMRIAARQVGRTLRRAHQVSAPGFGRPTVNGRWIFNRWETALHDWLTQHEFFTRGKEVLGEELFAKLRTATLDHPMLACERASLLHGAAEPSRVLVAVGDSIQLEALTRPGRLVGGDPLFDLAYATLPSRPQAFSQGVFEGYNASGPLLPEQEARLQRLRLLLHVTDTLWRADTAEIEHLVDQVQTGLAALA
jgi:aminoglycoside phosphotransferase (APT) family kinase protein